MSRLSDTLSKRADELGITQTELAEQLGMAQQSLSELFRGNVASPRKWREIAHLLQIGEVEMRAMMIEASEEGEKRQRMMRSAFNEVIKDNPFPSTPEIRNGGPVPLHTTDRMIPVLGEAVGGNDGEYVFNGQILDWMPAPPSLANVRDAYIVYIDGESMSPRYRPGESVYVHPSKPPRRGDDVIVQIRPNEEGMPPHGFVKEFVGWSGRELLLRQHNPAGEVRFAREDVVSVHPIVLAGKY